MERELGELGRAFPENFDMCSMIWFVITDEPMDQTPAGKGTNLLAGNAQQIEDILKRYKEAGMTMPLLWPPFRDVPTVQDHRRPQAPGRGDHAQGQRRVGPPHRQPAVPTPPAWAHPCQPPMPAIRAKAVSSRSMSGPAGWYTTIRTTGQSAPRRSRAVGDGTRGTSRSRP